MHKVGLFCLVPILSVLTLPCNAAPKVKVTTETYTISGSSGAALIAAMDRSGPKHGFLTRAIAQTRYTVAWDVETAQSNGACRLTRASATLHLNYTYPQVKGAMPAALKRRWQRFIAGVRKHEEMHGSIARQMVQAAERSVKGMTIPSDRSCGKLNAELKRRVNAVYADYERRQVAFDAREHRAKGVVEGLVGALIR